MANQRMYAICEICTAKKETNQEQCIQYLAKYYPSGGWSAETIGENLEKFFQSHNHRTQTGKYLRIVYDSEMYLFAKERDEIIGIVGNKP